MAVEREALRDWHRLFGLLLTDFFSGTPFTVEVERDLSAQQQLLDVVVVRRGRGRFALRLPDGLEGLVEHNLLTFKSHREALDGWAMRELVGHYVAYRKLVGPAPSELLPEEQFRLFAVCARFPHNLAGQVPWQERQPGVYDCRWGLDTVRVVVAGQLPRQPHNAPLHLFSASPDLVGFDRGAYRQHSKETSGLLWNLLKNYEGEGLAMSFTMQDFKREFVKKYFPQLTPEERQDVLQSLAPEERREALQALSPPEQRMALESLSPEHRQEVLQSLPAEERLAGLAPEVRLAGLSAEQIRHYLDQLTAGGPARPRKPRRKK
jgi:hypothetical protein